MKSPNDMITLTICWANSRVGARTKAWHSRIETSKVWRIPIAKVAVLPVPKRGKGEQEMRKNQGKRLFVERNVGQFVRGIVHQRYQPRKMVFYVVIIPTSLSHNGQINQRGSLLPD